MRVRQLIAAAIKGEPTRFLTLTLRRSDKMSAEQAARWMVCARAELFRRMAKKLRIKKIAHLTVMERHKTGWPHMHSLLRCGFVHVKWIKRQWYNITGSFIAWIEEIEDTRKAARYCAKYISKSLQKFRYSKRYTKSQDYCDETKIKAARSEWKGAHTQFHRKHISEIIERWVELGYRFTHQGPGFARALDECSSARGPP